MAAVVWRLGGIEVAGGGDLELTELRLLDASGPIDTGAVVTCSHVPVEGELAHLSDGDPATRCKWRAEDLRQPGFYIQWQLAQSSDFWALSIGVASEAASPSALRMTYLGESGWAVHKDFFGIDVPVVDSMTVGDSAGGSPLQGYLVSVVSGSGQASTAHTNTSSPTWDQDYAQTIGIGLFAAALTNPGDTGVRPTKTINEFSIHDELQIQCTNGSYISDVADMDMEFLRPDGGVVAAIRSRRRGNFSLQMSYGPSLSAQAIAGYVGSTPKIHGKLTFTESEMRWTPDVGGDNHTAWVFVAAMSTVAAIRFSQVRSSMGASVVSSGWVRVKRAARGMPVGYTGERLLAGVRVADAVVPSTAQPLPQGLQAVGMVAAQLAHDVEFGGDGVIHGTVEVKMDAQNLPLARRVRLHRSWDGLLVRETWSNAQGEFRFAGLNPRYAYDAIAWDHEGLQQSVVANDLTPEVMP